MSDIAASENLAVKFGTQILLGNKESLLKGKKDPQDGGGGLLLGSRELVVVSVDNGNETIPVKVVDHGIQQKEATRRLFDAHVFAQSFKQECEDKSEYIEQLRTRIKQLEEELVATGVARTPVEPAMDLTKLKLKMGAVDKVPQWLRNDQHSREIVAHFTNEILEDGPSGRKSLTDFLWLVMQAAVHRWAGEPDQLVQLQARAAEKRAREALQKSLRESSEMRSHLKMIERKYQELSRYHQQLQRELLTRGPPLSSRSGHGNHENHAVAGSSGPHAHTGLGGNANNGQHVGRASHSSHDNYATNPQSSNGARGIAGVVNIGGNNGNGTSSGNRNTGNGMHSQAQGTFGGNSNNGNGPPSQGQEPFGGNTHNGNGPPSQGQGHFGGNSNNGNGPPSQAQGPFGGNSNTGNGPPSQVQGHFGGNGNNGNGPTSQGQGQFAGNGINGNGPPSQGQGPFGGSSNNGNGPPSQGQGPFGGNRTNGNGAAGQGFPQSAPSSNPGRTGNMNTSQQNFASSNQLNTSGGYRNNDMAPTAQSQAHSIQVTTATGNVGNSSGMNILSPSGNMGNGGIGMAPEGVPQTSGSRQRDNRVSFMSWGGSYHDVEFEPEVLETMDNEVFEPLSMFDEDMQKLLIDVVDEKVRRILLLDPEKFEGRLPYGLKPMTDHSDVIKQLKEENGELKEANHALEEDVKRMRAIIEQLRKFKADVEKQMESKRTGDPVLPQETPVDPILEEPGKIWTDDDVQAAIASALAKLAAEHQKQIEQLEELLKKANSDLEAALKELALANNRIADLQAQLDAALKELEKLRKELDRLQKGLPREPEIVDEKNEKEKVVEKIIEKEKVIERIQIVKEIDREAAVSLNRMQVMMHMLLKTISDLTQCKTANKHSSAIELVIGASQDHSFKAIAGGARDKSFGSDGDVKPHQVIVDNFADWCQDVKTSIAQYRKPAPTVIHDVEYVPAGNEVVPNTDQQEEIDKLKKTCREQQEEISRLLLMIEELRLRLAQMQRLLQEKGGLTAEELEKALEEVGLKDLLDAKQANLGNVYERLYQDALQRMQRLALTLEQRAEAGKIYYQNYAAVQRDSGPRLHPDSLPLQRLTQAALAAIHGMFYHYDILFRRVCERAAADGLRNAATESYRLALSDLFGEMPRDPNFNALNSLCVSNGGEPLQNDKVQRRVAPKPRISNSAGALTPIAGGPSQHRFKNKQAGFSFGQHEAGAFHSYMTKLQQPDTQTSPPETIRSRPTSRCDSLGALTHGSKRPQISSSLSLPALPKGLASMKVVLPDAIGSLPNSAASHKTSVGGLASHESSLVLQDSWMSSEC